MLNIRLEKVKDLDLREIFKNILKEWKLQDFLLANFKHYEISFNTNVTNFKYPHNLGFIPKDVFITSQIGVGVAEFNYEDFDNQNFDITATDACTVRFFAGNFDKASRA